MARAPLAQPWLSLPSRRSGVAAAAPCRLWLPLRSALLSARQPSGVALLPPVPHAGAASITSPAPLISPGDSASETRNGPTW